MFDILNSRDFYNKFVADFQDYNREKTSARTAINCVLSAYHLAEWVWGDWLKKDEHTKRVIGTKTVDDFKAWLDENCYFFSTIQALANGSKHFDRRIIAKSEVTDTHLGVEVDKDGEVVWQDFSVVMDVTVMFWFEFMDTHSPYDDIWAAEQFR